MSRPLTLEELIATPVGELTIEQFSTLVRQQFACILRDTLERFHAEPRTDAAPKFLDRAGLAWAFSCELAQIDEMRREGMPVRLYVDGSPRFDVADCIGWLKEQAGPRVNARGEGVLQ